MNQAFHFHAGLLALSVGLVGTLAGLPAAADDQRARSVESSLRDLSTSNDAAIARQRIEPGRSVDALGEQRVVLEPMPRPSTEAIVRGEVEYNLHRLRRETVSAQTEDGRKARVNESLDRAQRGDP